MLSSWVSKFIINFHFVIFLIILIIEIIIAKYEFHHIIRGFVGDVLVIPLIYHFIRSCWDISPKKLMPWILLFAGCVEVLQFFRLVNLFGIESEFIKVIIGTTFDIWDLVAYLIGAFLVLFIKKQGANGANGAN